MNLEDLNDEELRIREAEIKERRSKIDPVFQHYGSVENLGAEGERIMEAEIKERRSKIDPVFQHYGSVENLDAEGERIMQAQVEAKLKKDIPYKEYLNNLIVNPTISDVEQFEEAVIRSMESNRIMKSFTSDLVEKISEVTYGFKNIGKTDIEKINNQKQKLEKLVNLYVKYLYELKKHDWTFYGSGNDIGLEMIDNDMLDDLWRVQKQFDISFKMYIPKDLGPNYGQAFEREGKLVPAITLMYDDLKNRDVNWHQVLIYKENELTPRQRYLQRREEALKQFDLARQEEINNTLANTKTQTQVNI